MSWRIRRQRGPTMGTTGTTDLDAHSSCYGLAGVSVSNRLRPLRSTTQTPSLRMASTRAPSGKRSPTLTTISSSTATGRSSAIRIAVKRRARRADALTVGTPRGCATARAGSRGPLPSVSGSEAIRPSNAEMSRSRRRGARKPSRSSDTAVETGAVARGADGPAATNSAARATEMASASVIALQRCPARRYPI